ncbi:C39 family peptidase [Thermosporothrix hazakensis]|jgi:HAMP domain-containing protein|nr:C39 family peptidase [Thermosporothrix hazakensis]GCE46446.1 hypothetical protein KTH_13150 [Thermosporothrix hazakensis]
MVGEIFMLTSIVTVLLVVVMVLIVASLVMSAWREYRRYKRALAAQTQLPEHPLDAHVTAIVHLRDGEIVGMESPPPPPAFMVSGSWYRRHRMLISAGFLVMIVLTLFIQTGLAEGTIERIQGIGLNILTGKPITYGYDLASHEQPQAPKSPTFSASSRVVRVDSADPSQYYNSYQLNTWSYSSCSGISMQMVMNAYGKNLKAADVLQVELDLGVWDVDLGLLTEDGIAQTAAHFGFNTSAGHSRSLQEVIDIANSGQPVIVSLRDAQYFPGGHLFVIKGGDANTVFTADSAPTNFTSMSRDYFASIWQGFSAVLTPR